METQSGRGKYSANELLPTAYAEIILLGNCALEAINLALSRHQPEYGDASATLTGEKAKIEEQGVRTSDEIRGELNKIRAAMARIAAEFGR